MKTNVDLTENMIFSTHSSNDFHVENILFRNITNTVSRFEDVLLGEKNTCISYYSQNELITVGNALDRKNYQFIKKSVSPLFCDCCGKELKIVPWKQHTGLCPHCESKMIQQFRDKCPWRIFAK